MEGLADFEEDEWPNACAVSSKAQHYKKGNVSFFVRVTACPTRYKDRDAIILATTDITEMLEREAQLLQASKMTTLGKMSAGIAHELNQPLNAINMGSEYLTMMVEEGKKISRENLVEVARQISEQVDRASEIMNRLREFGRKPDFARKKVDLNRAIRIVHGIAAQQLKLENIIVNLELEENIPFILAHNTRLEQVTFNLVTNARDAIRQKTKAGLETGGSTITIHTFAENDQVAVTVADNGIGIPENVRHKVFEPFFTTKEVGKGMGLGLSITYGIVKDYNGQIEIQSREGIGTTIKLTFPCADA